MPRSCDLPSLSLISSLLVFPLVSSLTIGYSTLVFPAFAAFSASVAFCLIYSCLLCSASSRTLLVPAFGLQCGGAEKFRRQWTDYLEQSAACTMSTRAVTDAFTCALNTHLYSTAQHC